MFPTSILVFVKSSSKGLNPLIVVVAFQSANEYMKSETLATLEGDGSSAMLLRAAVYIRLSPWKSVGKKMSAWPGPVKYEP